METICIWAWLLTSVKKWIQRQKFLEIFAAKGWFCKRVWFPFGRNESEQNQDDGATGNETREIQVVCFAYIFQTIFENVFCTL